MCLKAECLLLLFFVIGLSCWMWPSASVAITAISLLLALGAGNGVILVMLLRRRLETSSPEKAKERYLVSTDIELFKQWPGVGYRKSKFLEDRLRGDFASWDTTITGIDDGDGWVRVSDNFGDKFLPSIVRGSLVLLKQDTAEVQKQTPAGKGSPRPPPPGGKGKGTGKGKGKDSAAKGKGKGKGKAPKPPPQKAAGKEKSSAPAKPAGGGGGGKAELFAAIKKGGAMSGLRKVPPPKERSGAPVGRVV